MWKEWLHLGLMLVLICCGVNVQAQEIQYLPPKLMLLKTYHGQNLNGWVMSEKLDGIRGYWTGKLLYSRQKRILTPPAYFIKDFPPFALDGELFTERGDFENISRIVRSQKDKGWAKMKLYVFDVPNAEGNLWQRLNKLQTYLKTHPNLHIKIIPQIPIQSRTQMMAFFHQIVENGGEGIVVRNPTVSYQFGRSDQILKFKPLFDEECKVVAYHAGKGKFAGMLGAISCKNKRGTFRIGSGFSDNERRNPPPIGAIITYQYRGLTNKGLPRFATFYRVKSDVFKKDK